MENREFVTLSPELPSEDEITGYGAKDLLDLVREATCHLVNMVNRISQTGPALDRIEDIVSAQHMLLTEVLSAEKEAMFRGAAVEAADERFSLPYSIITPDMRFVTVNRSYALLFEFSPAQLGRVSFNQLIHPLDLPRFFKSFGTLLRGESGSCEIIEWRATGKSQFVLTKDTMWAIGACAKEGPQYIATVSEKFIDQEEAAMLVEHVRSLNGRNRRPKPKK